MGLSGAAMFAFIIIHMLGNLQIFLGPDTLNAYAKLLKASPEVLWGFRLGLLGVTAVHIWAAISLTMENRRARPAGYVNNRPFGATWGSRYMAVTGSFILFFIIYHILHFTVHAFQPAWESLRDAEGRHDVYTMVVEGFRDVPISLFYIVAVAMLCQHLGHGIQSFMQSLGLVSPSRRALFARLSQVVAVVIFLGMSAVPVAVMTGWLKAPPAECCSKAAH